MPEEEVELIDYLRVIRKRRWLIVGGTIACMIAALLISLLSPKVYEANLSLKVGQVWQNPLDDPNRVAEVINSEPFLDKVRQKTDLGKTAYKMKKEKIVVAKAIEKAAILVNLTTRANSPEKAVELAEVTADLVIQEHRARFDELMSEHLRYEKELGNQIQIIQKAIEELDAALKRQRTNPQVNAPAVILLQAQLEQKQSQLLGFVRELRDVRMANTAKARTENTKVVLPPVFPEDHVNPKIKLNVLIAGIVGLITVLMLAFFLEYLEQVKRRVQP